MNAWLVLASGLCLLGALVHGVGGEVGIVRALDPTLLRASFFGDGDVTKRFLRGCWHTFTVNFLVCAGALFEVAGRSGEVPTFVGRMIAIEMGGLFVVYVVLAAPRPSIVVRAPQWLLFAAIAATAYLGSRG